MRAIETHYDGRRFRSRVEARWAVFFGTLGWAYDYEPEGVLLPSGPYLPDFWLPEIKSWLEVKGAEPTEAEIQKCHELAAATGKRVLLAIGAPGGEGGLLWFGRTPSAEAGETFADRYELQADRRDERIYWLTAFDGSAWYVIGGAGASTNHDRLPGRYGKMDAAYKAATGARFEHGEKG